MRCAGMRPRLLQWTTEFAQYGTLPTRPRASAILVGPPRASMIAPISMPNDYWQDVTCASPKSHQSERANWSLALAQAPGAGMLPSKGGQVCRPPFGEAKER